MFVSVATVPLLSNAPSHKITLVVSISVSIAMYCLIQVYMVVKVELAPHSPLLKLFAIKAVGELHSRATMPMSPADSCRSVLDVLASHGPISAHLVRTCERCKSSAASVFSN